MNTAEKSIAVIAIVMTITILVSLFLFPELRYLKPLLLTCSVGFLANIGLMFVVLRDIFLRPFPAVNHRYVWIGLVLFCWPAIPYYLARYGLKPRR